MVPVPDYESLSRQVCSLVEGDARWLPALANVAALLAEALDDVSWVGFYLCVEGGDELVLGPFQGKLACTSIRWGSGVCGTAAAQDATQLVEDVERFPGHIACDSASRSELVIPIHEKGRVVGVLDLDSHSLARFSEGDARGIEIVVSALEEAISFEGMRLPGARLD